MSKAGVTVISCITGCRNQVLFIEIVIELMLCAKQHVEHCGTYKGRLNTKPGLKFVVQNEGELDTYLHN